MANAVFTTSESSAYDDQPELRYHFPRTYLKQVEQAVGDWIVYYEPRRTVGPNSLTGRQSYFAVAMVDKIIEDNQRPNHYYAFVKGYLELDHHVPFRKGHRYFESMLLREDGGTNKGAFGRSVRPIPRDEFDAILRTGLSTEPDAWEIVSHVGELDEDAPYSSRPVIERLQARRFRDVAFRRHVRRAYDNTCAVTGLRLINGLGRPEVQAAHIVPVEQDGPDTVRNGLALTGTVHWLFDRGLISIDESYRILIARTGVPDDMIAMLIPSLQLRLPPDTARRPHQAFLRWHREHRFKG